ncbi:hypothetical protein GY45DRAFT_1109339 [Cubamyces sp. BRFM 1775]|nr:hypothetical protein GY45DRAFT_1109339 [Cubamyces sp. BRFM 1775]
MAQGIPVVPALQDGVVLVSEPFEPQATTVEPPARPCKRKARQTDDEIWPRPPKKTRCAYDDPYAPPPNTHSSSSPVPTASSSSLSCSSPSSSLPLPSSAAMSLSPEELSLLSPIVVEPPNGFCCPMPGCGVPLPAKDTAWRSHFRRAHHKELCADARAGSCTGNCKYPCPLPKGDDDEHTCTTPMLVESIGRHFLNVHLGLRHQCPVCGLVDAWRFFACKRHIPVCPTLKAAKKEGETSTREGATPVKKERKKPTKKPRGRKARH